MTQRILWCEVCLLKCLEEWWEQLQSSQFARVLIAQSLLVQDPRFATTSCTTVRLTVLTWVGWCVGVPHNSSASAPHIFHQSPSLCLAIYIKQYWNSCVRRKGTTAGMKTEQWPGKCTESQMIIFDPFTRCDSCKWESHPWNSIQNSPQWSAQRVFTPLQWWDLFDSLTLLQY